MERCFRDLEGDAPAGSVTTDLRGLCSVSQRLRIVAPRANFFSRRPYPTPPANVRRAVRARRLHLRGRRGAGGFAQEVSRRTDASQRGRGTTRSSRSRLSEVRPANRSWWTFHQAGLWTGYCHSARDLQRVSQNFTAVRATASPWNQIPRLSRSKPTEGARPCVLPAFGAPLVGFVATQPDDLIVRTPAARVLRRALAVPGGAAASQRLLGQSWVCPGLCPPIRQLPRYGA